MLSEAARQANERLFVQRSQYESTTAPLIRVNDTLKEIKELLAEILTTLKTLDKQ